VAELADLVAPELEAHRLGHAEAVDVEDAAAHRVLADVVDHRHALEADAGEVGGEVLGAPHVAAAELEARFLDRARQLRALEHRARRGEQDVHVAARQPFERLDALARHLGVRLGLAERLAVWVERHLPAPAHRLEIGEPPLGLGHARRQQHEEALRVASREGGEDHRVARPVQAADADPAARSGQGLREPGEGRQRFDRVEQRGQCHACGTGVGRASGRSRGRGGRSGGARGRPGRRRRRRGHPARARREPLGGEASSAARAKSPAAGRCPAPSSSAPAAVAPSRPAGRPPRPLPAAVCTRAPRAASESRSSASSSGSGSAITAPTRAPARSQK
jgi:hypothetical protein